MLPSLLLAAALVLPATVLAQSARLAALGEEMVEREYDFTPLIEAYREGAGPRAGRPFIDIAPGWLERRRGGYRDLLQRMENLSTTGLTEAERTTLE